MTVPNPQDPFRVLCITSHETLLARVRTALGKAEGYLLLDPQEIDDALMDRIEKLQPNCILLDYLSPAANPLDLIDSITLQFPETKVVVILPKEKAAEANQVILAGARAFISQPFTQTELLDTVGRIKTIHQRSQQARPAAAVGEVPMSGRGTIVVFSPKGGVGCSSIAINLAMALQEQLSQEVLLMDAKLFFGDLDLMLNLKTQNSISDLVPHIEALDEGLIRDVVAGHVSGIKVMPAPTTPMSAQEIHPEELHRILTSVQKLYPYIVIDGGNFLNENTVTVMDASHRIILVLTPDIASLRDATRFFDLCRTTLSFPKEKILVVVNQNNQREGLSLQDIERTLQVKAFATLPWDPRVALQGINRGVPAFMQAQNNPLRKAFQSMAKNLAAALGLGEGRAPRTATMQEVLAKSSRLG